MNWNTNSNYGRTGHSQGGNQNYTKSYGEDRNEGGKPSYENKFPNSGAIFPVQQKRSQNSPDMTGYIEISEEVLDYILREAERSDTVKLELSAWMKMSRNNNNFTSVSINIPYGERIQGQNPTYRSQPGRPNANGRERPMPQRQSYNQGTQQTRSPQRQSVRQNYAEQSRGMSDREFKAGDRMPDFSDPNAPPF
jgi:hypothetical protein